MEQSVEVRKAYYLCSCTREYLTDDIPASCPCHMGEMGGSLTRVAKFRALRSVANNIPIYPEIGVCAGLRDSQRIGGLL